MQSPAHARLPAADPVPAAEAKDVIVIGAGIIGLCSALWLLRLGHRVRIIDPAPPEEGASYEHACSYGNACTIAYHACLPVAMPGIARRVPGMLLDPEGPLTIRWPHLPRMAPWILRFLRASGTEEVHRITSVLAGLLRLAEDAYAPLFDEADAHSLLRRDGCLYLYKTEQEFEAARPEIELRAHHRVQMDILGRDEIRQLEPRIAPLYARGLLFKDSYSIDSPHRLALALAAAVRERGGVFIRGEVLQVEPAATQVDATVAGGRYSADNIVLAGGAWSRELLRRMGEAIPLDTERGYHVFFPQGAGLISRPVCYARHGFYLTPVSGGIRAAGTVEFGSFERRINPVRTRKIASVASQLVPGIGPAGKEWLGFRPSLPDSLPVIGPASVDRRIIHAFGHGHIGMTLGGITGRVVADIVSGRPPALDLAPLRPDRFNKRAMDKLMTTRTFPT